MIYMNKVPVLLEYIILTVFIHIFPVHLYVS